MENGKAPIDERLEALVQSLELMRHDMEASERRMEALDARERRAREALLSGIAAYLRVLGEDDREGA